MCMQHWPVTPSSTLVLNPKEHVRGLVLAHLTTPACAGVGPGAGAYVGRCSLCEGEEA